MTDARYAWRKSTYSGSSNTCVEVATRAKRVLIRNSNHPDAGTLAVDPATFSTLLTAGKTGDLDELAR